MIFKYTKSPASDTNISGHHHKRWTSFDVIKTIADGGRFMGLSWMSVTHPNSADGWLKNLRSQFNT
ncbi:MAG: hypothetical protein ACI94O_001220 [Octadecabacter sp.]|jgi:hypothetical protein